ncbi:hypothetical protein DFP72DRAFT_843378 [Ephemerocybe angulata]|uniref:Uncharacterized protein n=1 Tax=Ephemerocybe angulata TaxID=980116 RepID=A0A8H6MDX8_9AGAR|nr:hypothetical protein DFP72DRAFT_843378 [Tulosesus angulatus]
MPPSDESGDHLRGNFIREPPANHTRQSHQPGAGVAGHARALVERWAWWATKNRKMRRRRWGSFVDESTTVDSEKSSCLVEVPSTKQRQCIVLEKAQLAKPHQGQAPKNGKAT